MTTSSSPHPFWTVAQTESQREHVAARALKISGFDTYLPEIKMKRRGEWLTQPLFPSYIFVRVVNGWHGIVWGIGVVRVLMAGEQPARLADSVIAQIQDRESRDGFIRLSRRRPLIGTKVRVLSGQFRGHIGLYDGMTARDRERVLLDLLGRSVPVELAQTDQIEPVTPHLAGCS